MKRVRKEWLTAAHIASVRPKCVRKLTFLLAKWGMGLGERADVAVTFRTCTLKVRSLNLIRVIGNF